MEVDHECAGLAVVLDALDEQPDDTRPLCQRECVPQGVEVNECGAHFGFRYLAPSEARERGFNLNEPCVDDGDVLNARGRAIMAQPLLRWG